MNMSATKILTTTARKPVRHLNLETGHLACHGGTCLSPATHSMWDESGYPGAYLGDACAFHASQAAREGLTLKVIS